MVRSTPQLRWWYERRVCGEHIIFHHFLFDRDTIFIRETVEVYLRVRVICFARVKNLTASILSTAIPVPNS